MNKLKTILYIVEDGFCHVFVYLVFSSAIQSLCLAGRVKKQC